MLYGGETIPEGDDGVYMLAKTCTSMITVNAQNIKIVQEDPETPLNNVSIIGPENGNANFWIDTLNINTQTSDPIIRFRGAENVLTLKGTSTLIKGGDNSAINVGNGLTLEACNYDATATLNVTSTGSNGIGIDWSSADNGYGAGYPQDGKLVNTNITVNSGTYIINASRGAGFGAADNTYIIGDINITGGDINITSNNGSAIGCGNGQIGCAEEGLTGNIKIGRANVTVENTENCAGIGAGSLGNLQGNIIVSSTAKISSRDTTELLMRQR